MRTRLLFVLLLAAMNCMAQISEPFKELKGFTRAQPPKIATDTSPYLQMASPKGNNYLAPLYKAFVQELKGIPRDTTGFYEMLAQAVSFVGDHRTVLAYERASYEKIPDSIKAMISKAAEQSKDLSYIDAKQYIVNRAKHSRVVMINEAHDKPQTRVFTASLLEDLFKQGFRYLALEMLDNFSATPVLKINAFSGYYTAEPIAAELIRKALEIGYTLVPYEDTARNHTVNQREYAQAQHIVDFIATKDTSAKILVHAGYSHIEEGARSDDHIPMAAYFKLISGIDPLTIDQTEMIEQGNSPYAAWMYDSWMRNKPLTTASIALNNDVPVDPYGFNLYDIHVIHPPTKYQNERALWTSMNGWKNEIAISPAYKTVFFIQAFYANEYNAAKPDMAIPADQTYLNASNGIYYLYLRKGKYKIVFRDKSYEILGIKDIVVN